MAKSDPGTIQIHSLPGIPLIEKGDNLCQLILDAIAEKSVLSISDEDNFETVSKKIHILEHKILPLSISQAGYIIRNGSKGND